MEPTAPSASVTHWTSPGTDAEGAEAAPLRRSPAAITLDWLARMRWGAVIGQAVTVSIAKLYLRLDLPLLQLGVLVAATAISNVALWAWLRRAKHVSERAAVIVLGADTLVLTGLLYFSGGPTNPFSVLYLVHVTLAALVLGLGRAIGVVSIAAASYSLLFFWHRPIAGMEHAHPGGPAFSTHLQGMWIAFTIAALLIAYFVSRVAAELRARESELAKAQRLAARAEKLASLTTLAAGAAHELGTPLGTIAVASKELEHSIRSSPAEAVEDARMIRTEVERCKAIIHRMSARAGITMGEMPDPTTTTAVLEQCLERLGRIAAERVEVKGDRVPVPFACHVEGLVQVLLNLVQNGLDASRDSNTSVVLESRASAASVCFVVSDQGRGIAPEHLSRIGEPFFTTKAPGEGMGLGVFLVHAFAERCGGALRLTSQRGFGTRVELEIPRKTEANRDD